MKIGVVGCGKLGLPVALAIESKGHQVKGYDVSDAPARYLRDRKIPFEEKGIPALLKTTRMEMIPLQELCDWADILFLAPQTPHAAEFEGITPLPSERCDFDYRYLIQCAKFVDLCLKAPKTCVIISTVLPGTMEREILPLLSENFRLIYSPQFIAMGTVLEDFTHPEFWLVGSNGPWNDLEEFYFSISAAPFLETDIRTAEGIKVLYNTFITAKTVLANLYGEMAHKMGMNVDDIYEALCLSTNRLLSPKYLKAGMGDGGGCHPRDNIALSYVARRVGLSFDFFDALMTAREKHCEFLADIIQEHGAHVFIMGREFKPETNIMTGSPALLLANILERRGVSVSFREFPAFMGTYFIGCKHERYKGMKFPAGSVVIDPFRYLPQQEGINLIQIGAGREVVDSCSDATGQKAIPRQDAEWASTTD